MKWSLFFSLSTIIMITLFSFPFFASATPVRKQKKQEMAFIPVGPFSMGYDKGKKDEGPFRKVYLNQYFIDTHEVTNEKYSLFVIATGKEPALYSSDKRFMELSHPVTGVDWRDAAQYCRWREKRLPTEAEWEKAARGTDGRLYPWGNSFGTNKGNISDADDLFPFTAPVGSFPAGASPYGIFDMIGNLWEWTADWYGKDYYSKAPAINPKGPMSGTLKVLRGSSWFNPEKMVRVTKRYKSIPDNKSQTYGFRCAMDPTGDEL